MPFFYSEGSNYKNHESGVASAAIIAYYSGRLSAILGYDDDDDPTILGSVPV